MTKLKIFVSYKYKKPVFQNEIVTPIQTGRAISDEIFYDMIGDDTGDNISAENKKYCELSAQYWIWKHYEEIGNPEYVGFMHYRRQFIFDKKLKTLPYTWLIGTKFYFVDDIYDNYIKHFSAEKIYPHLSDDVSCITFPRVDIRPISKRNNMRSHFSVGMPYQKEEVFDVMEKVIHEYYPNYVETFEEFKNGTEMFCCNSFIMKKDLFFEYSEFLFGVLQKVDELVDSKDFSADELRFLGFLGEYLLSIFVFDKLKDPAFKLKELPGTYVCKDYKKIDRRRVKYKILSQISFGKKHIHYMKKYLKYKKHYVGA